MEIENVTGICFSSGRTANKQGQCAVCNSVLTQIVINDEDVLTLLAEIFRHSTAAVRSNILQGRTFGRTCRNDDGVFHSSVAKKLACKLGNRRALLSDCDVDTDNVGIFLIDNGIDGDFGFTRLSVADDKLTLTSADRNHTVDCLDTCLERNVYTFSFDNAGCF